MKAIVNLAAEADSILTVIAAGVEARYYVRGAFDPRYAEPSARDAAAKALASVSPTVAAAFLRGWCAHHEAPTEPFVWHRYIGGQRIEVAA